MKPSISQILMGGAGALNTDIAPHIKGDPYALGAAGIIGLLMILSAQESERAADTLVSEQEALRVLFADAAGVDLPAPLRAELARAASAPAAPSLRLADLESETAALKALLIRLHEALEASPFDWAEALEARIWEILKLGAACRALYLPTL